MEERGILLLGDPLRQESRFLQMKMEPTKALVPDAADLSGGGRCLSRAQAALYELKQRCGWVCVAAEGSAVWLALALAAQLMVDRLALWMEPEERPPRGMRRIRSFAGRNLWLVTGELLIIDGDGAQARSLIRGLGKGCSLRFTDAGHLRREQLIDPWTEN